jgi:hypothetical protein
VVYMVGLFKHWITVSTADISTSVHVLRFSKDLSLLAYTPVIGIKVYGFHFVNWFNIDILCSYIPRFYMLFSLTKSSICIYFSWLKVRNYQYEVDLYFYGKKFYVKLINGASIRILSLLKHYWRMNRLQSEIFCRYRLNTLKLKNPLLGICL